MTDPRIVESIRADWDAQQAHQPTPEDYAAHYDREYAKVHRDNDLTPVTIREWVQRGPDRRQADRRQMPGKDYVLQTLDSDRLTWRDFCNWARSLWRDL